MSRLVIIIISILISGNMSFAQKFNIQLEGSVGLNTSFCGYNAGIDNSVSFHELDRNFSFNSSRKANLGYGGGLVLSVYPVEGAFGLKSGIFLMNLHNSCYFSLDYEAYWYTPWRDPADTWSPEHLETKIENELKILKIYLSPTYTVFNHDVISITLFGGISGNILLEQSDLISHGIISFDTGVVYSDFVFGNIIGLRAGIKRYALEITYERSFDILDIEDESFFERGISVERMNLQCLNVSVSYTF